MCARSREEMVYLVNPRPDLVDDADFWARLLLKAYPLDGDDPDGLFWALHGMRCLGARLEVGARSLMLRPGEMTEEEYRKEREKWLVPHAELLSNLLAEARPKGLIVSELLEKWSEGQIRGVNGGAIPQTVDECEHVAVLLVAAEEAAKVKEDSNE